MGRVVLVVYDSDDDDNGSELGGEVFADTTSFSKTGIAEGVTATAMKMRMIDSMSAREFPQTSIFDRHEARPQLSAIERRNKPPSPPLSFITPTPPSLAQNTRHPARISWALLRIPMILSGIYKMGPM